MEISNAKITTINGDVLDLQDKFRSLTAFAGYGLHASTPITDACTGRYLTSKLKSRRISFELSWKYADECERNALLAQLYAVLSESAYACPPLPAWLRDCTYPLCYVNCDTPTNAPSAILTVEYCTITSLPNTFPICNQCGCQQCLPVLNHLGNVVQPRILPAPCQCPNTQPPATQVTGQRITQRANIAIIAESSIEPDLSDCNITSDYMTIPVTLLAHDPIWWLDPEQTVQWLATTNGQIQHGIAIAYAGTWYSEPIIELYGPLTNPQIWQASTGAALAINANIIAGDKWTIDLRDGRKRIVSDQLGTINNAVLDLTIGLGLDQWRLVPPQPATASGVATSNRVQLIASGAVAAQSGFAVRYYTRLRYLP